MVYKQSQLGPERKHRAERCKHISRNVKTSRHLSSSPLPLCDSFSYYSESTVHCQRKTPFKFWFLKIQLDVRTGQRQIKTHKRLNRTILNRTKHKVIMQIFKENPLFQATSLECWQYILFHFWRGGGWRGRGGRHCNLIKVT